MRLIVMLLCSLSSLAIAEIPYPYSSIKETLPPDYNPEPRNWMHYDALSSLMKGRNIKVVVEVGTWNGNSTITLAKMIPEDGVIHAVDHWFQTKQYYRGDAGLYAVPGNKEYIPKVYQQFLSNVIHAKLTHRIIPHVMSSLKASKELARLNVVPDLIYIDAAHDEDSVYEDITAWFPFVKGHGLMFGDDWNWSEGPVYTVMAAVQRFAKENNLHIYVSPNNSMWALFEK